MVAGWWRIKDGFSLLHVNRRTRERADSAAWHAILVRQMNCIYAMRNAHMPDKYSEMRCPDRRCALHLLSGYCGELSVLLVELAVIITANVKLKCLLTQNISFEIFIFTEFLIILIIFSMCSRVSHKRRRRQQHSVFIIVAFSKFSCTALSISSLHLG